MSHKIDFTTIKINPKFIQSGTITVTLQKTGTTGGVSAHTFDTPFVNTPNVILTPQYATGYLGSATLASVSTTSFSCLMRGDTVGTTSQREVCWVAIDYTQPPLIAA